MEFENVVITQVGTIEVEWIHEDGSVQRRAYMKEEVNRAWQYALVAGWVTE